MTRPRHSHRLAAFTLIEVLVALVILSTGIVVVLQAFQTSLVALGEARDALWSDMLVREKLTELELALAQPSADLPEGTSEGAFSGRYADFRWELDVRSVPAPVDEAQMEVEDLLREIKLTVSRAGSDRRRVVETRFCIRPKAGGAS